MGKRLNGRVGLVARFKPFHFGHTIALETICEQADEFAIGLGSCNVYDYRSPFTAKESKEMIEAVLGKKFSNYSFVEVPDLFDGPKWREQVLNIFGKLNYFITGNGYVKSLLEKDYVVIHPSEIVPRSKWTPITGTAVRLAMARGYGWENLIPPEVLDYIKSKKLDERFCKEFGLETLAKSLGGFYVVRKL